MDRVAEPRQQPRHPRAVRAGLQHDDRSRITARESGQALAGVRDLSLGENLAAGREDAGAVLAVPEVDSNGYVVRVHKA